MFIARLQPDGTKPIDAYEYVCEIVRHPGKPIYEYLFERDYPNLARTIIHNMARVLKECGRVITEPLTLGKKKYVGIYFINAIALEAGAGTSCHIIAPHMACTYPDLTYHFVFADLLNDNGTVNTYCHSIVVSKDGHAYDPQYELYTNGTAGFAELTRTVRGYFGFAIPTAYLRTILNSLEDKNKQSIAWYLFNKIFLSDVETDSFIQKLKTE